MKPTTMTEQDYEKLGSLLAKLMPQGAMSLEQLDGFLAALHAGPEALGPSDCLPTILGEAFDDDEAFTPKQLDRFMQLITGHWRDIGHTLSAGEAFHPWLEADEQGVVSGNDWAIGFREGMEIFHDDWNLLFDDEANADALTPIMALAFEHEPDSEMHAYLADITQDERDSLLAEIGPNVGRIYQFFAGLRAEMLAAESDANQD